MSNISQSQTSDLKTQSRGGDFIRTYSGVHFWPIDPRPDEVKVIDIAHALALKVRWQGHCKKFYSVGTHSLRVAELSKFLAEKTKYSPELLYAYGLVHDATEAYLPDVPTPVKPYIAEWKNIEGRVEAAIWCAFHLPPITPEIKAIVKTADRVLLKIESEELFDGSWTEWPALENINVTMDMKIVASTVADAYVEKYLADELARVQKAMYEIHLHSEKQKHERARKVRRRKGTKRG